MAENLLINNYYHNLIHGDPILLNNLLHNTNINNNENLVIPNNLDSTILQTLLEVDSNDFNNTLNSKINETNIINPNTKRKTWKDDGPLQVVIEVPYIHNNSLPKQSIKKKIKPKRKKKKQIIEDTEANRQTLAVLDPNTINIEITKQVVNNDDVIDKYENHIERYSDDCVESTEFFYIKKKKRSKPYVKPKKRSYNALTYSTLEKENTIINPTDNISIPAKRRSIRLCNEIFHAAESLTKTIQTPYESDKFNEQYWFKYMKRVLITEKMSESPILAEATNEELAVSISVRKITEKKSKKKY